MNCLALVPPEPKRVVDVLVYIFQGAVDKVRVLSHVLAEEAVREWCKEQKYVSYQHFIVDRQTRAILKEELNWYRDVPVEDL